MIRQPRQTIEEFRLEVQLTAAKYLVVEGPSDARFFTAWLKQHFESVAVHVLPVEGIEIPDEEIQTSGMNVGNRSRVVLLARELHDEADTVRCLADRDCGEHLDEHDYATLLWTDFPALESYTVSKSVLEHANLISFGARLPEAEELLSGLAFALRELFAVRVHHPHLPRPKYSAGMGKQPNPLSAFDVSKVLTPAVAKSSQSYQRSEASDPRHYSYGHDISELLLAAFANVLKNSCGISRREAVEAALLGALLAVAELEQEPLFAGLIEWVQAA